MDEKISFGSTINTRILPLRNTRRVIIRSDAPFEFDKRGIELLRRFDIRDAVDLRSKPETERTPCGFPNCVKVHRLSLHENGVLPRDGGKIGRFYFEMAKSAEKSGVLGEILRVILNSDGGVVFFCRSGKDRTGVIAALLLRMAGVSDEDIADDYEKSGENLAEIIEEWLSRHPDYPRDAVTPKRRHILEFLALLSAEQA